MLKSITRAVEVDRLAVNEQLAAGGMRRARKNFNERTFPRAILPKERADFPRLKTQRDAVKRHGSRIHLANSHCFKHAQASVSA